MLHVLDQSAIYLLIAGTYTPVLYVPLHHRSIPAGPAAGAAGRRTRGPRQGGARTRAPGLTRVYPGPGPGAR